MRSRTRLILGAAAVTALAGGIAVPQLASAADPEGLRVIGLAGQGTRLVGFTTDDPGAGTAIGRITGLVGDTRLVGIDHRVQDGLLYGVGDQGGVYTLDARARATRTAAPALPLDGSARYGVDFNPAADALRVISARGQNLRLPMAVPGSPVAVDTPLTRPVVPATTPPTTEPALGLTGAAYTNNDLDATTATTLFDIDTQRDQVTLQSPANSGQTSATGNLGVDFEAGTGFDAYSVLDPAGKTLAVLPYALSGDVLYLVNPLTGAATAIGAVDDKTTSDIALPLDQE